MEPEKREVSRRDRADHTVAGELPQAIERKRDVRVGRNARVIETLATMRVDERAHVDARGNLSITDVAAEHARVERCLIRKHQRRARNQDTRVVASGLRGGARNRVDAPPRIRAEEHPDRRREFAQIPHATRARSTPSARHAEQLAELRVRGLGLRPAPRRA